MSNHVHDIVRNRPDIARTWSDEEVVWRWKLAWPRYENGRWTRSPTDEELEEMLQRGREQEHYLPALRRNLADISWHQARFKETIAKMCNAEVDRRGHHWEARFGNRRLDSDEKVVTAFLYNDLQQVRAGIVDTVEASDYSALQRQVRSHAREAFQDVHGRPPRDDEDGGELEQLEALFANCFLSPIGDGGPLTTVNEQNAPPSELVLPQGYLFEQSAEEEGRNDKRDGQESSEAAPSCEPRPRRRGRRRRSRKIHRRLRERLRRRASRSSILAIPWEQYYELLKRLAELERKAAAAGRDGPQPEGPPGAVPDSCSPTSFHRGAGAFAAWLRDAAARLPARLAALLLPGPRGDPDVPPSQSD